MDAVSVRVNIIRQRAAAAADPAAEYFNAGMDVLNGALGEEGKVHAAQLLQSAAELGHMDAMFELGMCYRWGDGGVYCQAEDAIKWFRAAAEKGHEKAQEILKVFDSESGKNLITMSAMHGAGGAGSKWYKVKVGVDFYYSEAEKGNAECQYELARQLADPNHFGPFRYDIQQAIHWYSEAGNQGVVDAMFNLAVIYLKGAQGQEIDRETAKIWFQKAADAGDADAKRIVNDPILWL